MADALSKPDPTLWRLRPRAPMPGTVLGPLEDIPDGDAREYVFGRGTTVFSMFVVRRGHSVYGYLNICPHYSSALTSRRPVPQRDKSHIRCTMHYAEFRSRRLRLRVRRTLLADPVPVHVENNQIVISP